MRRLSSPFQHPAHIDIRPHPPRPAPPRPAPRRAPLQARAPRPAPQAGSPRRNLNPPGGLKTSAGPQHFRVQNTPVGNPPLEVNLQRKPPIPPVPHRSRPHPDIPNMRLFHLVKVNIPDNPRSPPHILILDVTRVRPFEHFHHNLIPPVNQMRTHIELRRQPRALTETHIHPVHPNEVHRLHPVETENRPPAPLFSVLKKPTVETRGIVRGNFIPVNRKRIALIGVMQPSEPLILHRPGHPNRPPFPPRGFIPAVTGSLTQRPLHHRVTELRVLEIPKIPAPVQALKAQ